MMRSFILSEKPGDRLRNRLIIGGFLLLTIFISYFIYNFVSYGMSMSGVSSTVYNSSGTNDANYLRSVKIVCGDNNQFKTYVAKNESDKEKGLSIFSTLDKKEAMIFVFDNPQKYSFWMKDMKFPVDMVWLDVNKQIVDIAKNVAVDTYPKLFSPRADSLYVVEFKAGVTDDLKIKIGDSCSFDSLRLK